MAGWMWSTKEFLDYDSYKSKLSSIWDSIWDKVESLGDGIENLGDKIDIDVTPSENAKEVEIEEEKNDEKVVEKNTEKEDSSKSSNEQTIKSFPKSVDFVGVPKLNNEDKQEKESENYWVLTWYSKADLLWVINKYIEKNLDDDTDILVTVEYEDDSKDPQKIILQTQSKNLTSGSRSVSTWVVEVRKEENVQKSEPQKVNNIQQNKSSNKLTQKEIKETEEIFNILF